VEDESGLDRVSDRGPKIYLLSLQVLSAKRAVHLEWLIGGRLEDLMRDDAHLLGRRIHVGDNRGAVALHRGIDATQIGRRDGAAARHRPRRRVGCRLAKQLGDDGAAARRRDGRRIDARDRAHG
jgi:hypothetical protein